MTTRVLPEPKSWADLLKQKESERNQPPPKEFYVKEKITVHEEGGIFPDTSVLQMDEPKEFVDTSFYATDQLFQEEEADKNPRPFKPNHDHGNEPFIWPTKNRYIREKEDAEKLKTRPLTKRDQKNRDFDLITGVPFENGFKNTVKQLLDQKEKSNSFRMSRNFDPISNTFPTAELETTRLNKEALEFQANVTKHLEKMPPTIQRANNGTLNIITGECTDEHSLTAINEFPNSDINRGVHRWARESQIVETREIQHHKEEERIGCRYNNGRERMLRDFNIINGNAEQHSLDVSVKHKPSVWQWCQAERLET
ncbi:hypothetical protein TRFO_04144 [Tritrichomonas foetus]|uniref:Uncharacterized protein n=1 Tax=Tritrichomonas foetus TaxID=1144522 RepID=A0A1J4KLG9_9EUKA|nr:hypothetical protein TRFO_04144 [Tritrichomonas foetus]|eukprot:OHT10644.1 hypothetical protein TRFO_04144 [Tritrichomonas foetus]